MSTADIYSPGARGHYSVSAERHNNEQGVARMAEPEGGVAPRDPSGERLRVVIGENNADLALTLTVLLDAEADMQCVASASSAAAILQTLEAHDPNTFVLDLSLDDGPSLPLISTLRARRPQAVIVVFTGHKNSMLDQHCLEAGANAVVLKTGEIDELTAALRRSAAQLGWG
jgi:DNA-binding NarL/FixJ family response regulator